MRRLIDCGGGFGVQGWVAYNISGAASPLGASQFLPLTCCCRCHGFCCCQTKPNQVPAKVPRLSEEALRKLAEGFASYKNLPLTSSHPYWAQLIPRCGGSRCLLGTPCLKNTTLEWPAVLLLVCICNGLCDSMQDTSARPGIRLACPAA
jgi:hypothetical protein